MKKATTAICQKNYLLLLNCFVLFLFILPTFSYSQEIKSAGYRTLKAYIDDFAKNELFIKKSLIEYSNSIIENQLESRSLATSNRITEKLKSINANIKQNDKGFEKNTLLRDSFIKMNEKTIECLSNGTLIMNDYTIQSQNSVTEISQNLKERELALIGYFEELKQFEKSKKEFGKMNNINIKNFSGNNVLEYNAYQNVLFYKINVIDEKLNTSIIKVNKDEFIASINALDNAYQEVLLKTSQYKPIFNDTSLNSENIAYSNFIYSQKKKIIPLFNDFANEYAALQKLKKMPNNNSKESIDRYNLAVKSYYLKKNALFDILDIIQKNKKIMYNNWFVVNRTFLKNNIKVTDIYESYTFND